MQLGESDDMDEKRLDRIEKNLDTLGGKIDGLAKVVTDMARVEERMLTLFNRMDKYDRAHERMADRVLAIESVTTKRGVVYHGVEKLFWVVVGGVVAFGTKVVGGGN